MRAPVSIRRADRCLVEAKQANAPRNSSHVSIRRADRCLVEVLQSYKDDKDIYKFQSAVRIAVWLKCDSEEFGTATLSVSIRRADRCLVEAQTKISCPPVGLVSIRRADRCLVEVKDSFGKVADVWVSIRRADRCLVEGGEKDIPAHLLEFQSAVRIAVWLKTVGACPGARVWIRFQSAVRIAVWLKTVAAPIESADGVSIRRADRCLVEAHIDSGLEPGVIVSIRRADRCLVEEQQEPPHLRAKSVSIRRADRCLVEAKRFSRSPVRVVSFNPPCGSLFG